MSMILPRLAIVIGALLLASTAQAQTARVVTDCSGEVRRPGDGGTLIVDQNGRLCTTLGTSGGQAVSGSAAAGGISTFSRIPSSAASSNLTNAKPSPGRAYTYQGCNTTASTIYLRIYNAASTAAVTVGTTTPFAGPYAFPANNCLQPTNFASDIGIYGSSGLTYAFGTSPADTDTAAIGAAAITAFQIGYQ
jgi:hypothetical protein